MLLKNFLIGLSENQTLNTLAKKYGFKLGAQSVVAGENADEVVESIRVLNSQGISATIVRN